MLKFAHPIWLILAATLPLVAYLGWPRHAATRRRDGLSLAMRIILLGAIILALSGFSLPRRSTNLDVVFVLDWSDSLPAAAKSEAITFVQQALETAQPDDRAALIVFGQDALVERSLSAETELGAIHSLPVTSHTDLEEALRLAMSLLPPDNARRIVVLTDGAYTTGEPSEMAALIRAAGIDLRFVCYPFGQVSDPRLCRAPSNEQPDAALLSAHLPASVHYGEALHLQVRIQANTTISGTLEVRDQQGNLLYGQPYTARAGLHSLDIPLPAQSESGLRAFTIEFIPTERDFYVQNNRQSAYTTVLGVPRVLVVAPPVGETLPFGGETRPDEAAPLIAALQKNDLQVRHILPQALPASLEELSDYSAIVLVDVPAAQLSQRQMQAVQRYVRDLGGGLIVIGGPTSFGVGGYYRTPLESALPVNMQIKDEQRRPKLGIVYIIDHSGSMMESSGGATKLNLAKEAAIRSVNLLMPGDQVGVIAFDDSASWVVPMQALDDPASIQSAISHISGGGGTDIYAGLKAMSDVLPEVEAQIKHVILLTDGGADPTGIPEMVRRLYEQEGITLTTIGVGRDAILALKDWAAMGGGRYHLVLDPSTLPAIFTTETALVTRSYIEEGAFVPARLTDSPLLPPGGLPPLYGYVATEAKRNAQVILQSEKEDPILAWWRYGLGKSLAFTSDASGRWGHDWVAWEGYAFFWSQTARAILNTPQTEALQASVQDDGEKAHLTVLASTPEGQPMNGYDLQATLLPPDGPTAGQAYTLTLTQTASGRYEGDFIPQDSGVYLIHLRARAPEGEETAATTAWAYSYPAEYRPQSAGDRLVRLLATLSPQATSTLLLTAPGRAFSHDLPAPVSAPSWWQTLLALAVMLLPLEVAVRRLIIGKEEIALGGAALARRFRRPKRKPAPQGSRVRTLFRVKRQPQGTTRPLKGRLTPPAPPRGAAPPSSTEETSRAAPPVVPSPPKNSRETTSRLLAQKRSRTKNKGK